MDILLLDITYYKGPDLFSFSKKQNFHSVQVDKPRCSCTICTVWSPIVVVLQCFILSLLSLALLPHLHAQAFQEGEGELWWSRWHILRAPLDCGGLNRTVPWMLRATGGSSLRHCIGAQWGWAWLTSDVDARRVNASLPSSEWILLSRRGIHWNTAKGNILTSQCNFLRYVWKWNSLY